MSEDGTPIKEKNFSTPEAKDKTRSKFKNILDDLELKMAKPKSFVKKIESEKDSTNSKLDTNNSNTIIYSNNKNTIKEFKNKTQSISNNKSEHNNLKININKKIRKFNSFEEGSLKNGIKGNNTKIKQNESIEKKDK